MRSPARLISVAVLASILTASVASAQTMGLAAPLVVRFVGTFTAYDEKRMGDLDTLTMHVDGQKWLFKVQSVNTQAGNDPGMMLLNHLFPPELYFIGPERRLEPFKSPKIAGKRFTIEGFLYIADNQLYISAARADPTQAN
jgi:hypothetical protein